MQKKPLGRVGIEASALCLGSMTWGPRSTEHGARLRGGSVPCLDIARRHRIDPVQMALAWMMQRPFTTPAVSGATSAGQLAQALGEEVRDEIDAAHRAHRAHRAHPMPFWGHRDVVPGPLRAGRLAGSAPTGRRRRWSGRARALT